MARVSVVAQQEEYDEVLQLLEALSALSEQGRPVLNGTKQEDSDGRVWYGYDYSGASWWITKSMAAESDTTAEPYEFAEQKEPHTA